MALLETIDFITNSIDNNEIAVGIFIDLKKAFDTVNHRILYDKLFHYGIRGLPLKWIISYLTERRQYVCINETNSCLKLITCGVPQGSILGPLFFLVYINDLQYCSSVLNFVLFADDTNLFYSHKDIVSNVSTLNLELENLGTWLKCNRLSLNVEKTCFIVFGNKKKTGSIHVELAINNSIINRVSSTKFLGLIVDESLTWLEHIHAVENKISKMIGLLLKAKHHLCYDSMCVLYNAFIQPYIEYCNIIWASNYKTRLERLIKLQKRAVRLVTKSGYLEHTGPLFKKTKILTVNNVNALQVSIFMFKYYSHFLPAAFDGWFNVNSDFHEHNTRSKNDCHVMCCKTKLRAFSIKIHGPLVWNKIESEIKAATSMSTFKKLVKNILLYDDAYDS